MNAYERESIINFNDAEDEAEICTFQTKWLTKLRKHKEAKKVRNIEMDGKIIGQVWSIPKNCITLKRAKRLSRLTEEQRKAAAERMKLFRREKRRAANPSQKPLIAQN